MQYLLFFHHNNGYANAPQYYVYTYIACLVRIWSVISKGKVIRLQALRLCTGRTAQRGRRGIVLLFLDHGTRMAWGVSVTPRPLFTPRKDPVPIVQEAGWAPGPVWTGAENLTPTGIRSPDGQRHAPAALDPQERTSTHCTGVRVGPRAGLDRCGKSRPPPTGIRSPDRSARSQSLYRLSYPTHSVISRIIHSYGSKSE